MRSAVRALLSFHARPQMMSVNSVIPRRIVAVTVLSAMVIVNGCATYRPIDRTSAPTAGEVRLELTERGTLELGPQIGAGIVYLDGSVVSASDSSVKMTLKQVVNRSGGVQQWVGESVTIPAGYVNLYRKREPSAMRSLALGASLAAAAIGVAVAFVAGNSGSARGDGTPIQK
jgi:hypothetical protein